VSGGQRVLDRLFRREPGCQLVLGTHIWPLRLIGHDLDFEDPASPAKVVARLQIENHEVIVTRMGGLFVAMPDGVGTHPAPDGHQRQLEFKDQITTLFNRVLCELAIQGTISEPASPVEMGPGLMLEDHALIFMSSGGRESYLRRTVEPTSSVLRGDWRTWGFTSPDHLRLASEQHFTNILVAISPLLPTLVAGAYSACSRGHIADAVAGCWFACEQLIAHLYRELRNGLPEDDERRGWLGDIGNVGARIEVLYLAGKIDEEIYRHLQRGRKVRNDLVHRAAAALNAAESAGLALHGLLERIGQRRAAPLQMSRASLW
jgi:hypothetical protein